MLGNWCKSTEHLTELQHQFMSASPFPHIIIDEFFDVDYANSLLSSFPPLSDKWIKYWNPIEKKFALNKFTDDTEIFSDMFSHLQKPEVIDLIKQITGINNLEADPHLHGAGLHCHPPGGKLDMHLDYSIHPITGKERRVNLIVYLNKDWEENYGGDIQLWDSEFTEAKQNVFPLFNRAVIFQTNDISYHGMPYPVKCPEGNSRKSIAIYYVSDPTHVGEVRYKAHFRPLPRQPIHDQLRRLFEIRNTQSITPALLQEIYPQWEDDPIGKGVWF